jgi:hypothetical protein
MKRCSKCDTDKKRSAFYPSKQRKDGLSGECKLCSNKRSKKNMVKNRKLWNEFIGFRECELCGYNKCQAAMEFHHATGEKKLTVGNFKDQVPTAARKAQLLEEFKKGIFVCANCHREIHATKGADGLPRL